MAKTHNRLLQNFEAPKLIYGSFDMRSSRRMRYAIFGLLSVTGMRVGEVLNLDLEDVDLDHGVLIIRNSKLGKSRLVPMHATAGRSTTAHQG
jgi:integrase